MDTKTTTRRDVLKYGAASACIPAFATTLSPGVASAQSLIAPGVIRVLPGDPTVASVHAIQKAINDLQASGGGIVELVAGTYVIHSRLVIHNLVTIRGNNGRTTEIQPASNYSDSYMFEFRNPRAPPNPGGQPDCSDPYCSQFNCRLENLAINALAKTNITAIVWAPSWNEQCGLRNVLIKEYSRHAVLFNEAHGGTATIEIDGCEFMSANNAGDSYAGLKFDVPQTVGYTNVILNHVIVSGPITRVVDYVAIQALGRINLVATGVHFEMCDHGVHLFGPSGLTASGLTGSPTRTLHLITCASNFSGKVFGAGVLRAGATGHVLHDNKNARHVLTERNPLTFP